MALTAVKRMAEKIITPATSCHEALTFKQRGFEGPDGEVVVLWC
jgi:hypothetical protein